MSDPLAKLDALLSFVASYDDEDDLKVPPSASSDLWKMRKSAPVGGCGLLNTVSADNAVYLLPDHLTAESAYLQNYCNGAYVDPSLKDFPGDYYRYCPERDGWQSVGRYPPAVVSLYKTASYCPDSGKVTIIGGTHYVFAQLDLKRLEEGAASTTTTTDDNEDGKDEHPEWNLIHTQCPPDKPLYETNGPLPISFYIDGVLHMIGGHYSREHYIFKDGEMRSVFTFDSALKAREVAYSERLDCLFMFGGCLWNDVQRRKDLPFRKIDAFYVCPRPRDVDRIEWRKVREWRLPHRMIGFGHLLLADTTTLLVFGGRRSGGAFLDEVWRLDLLSGRWARSKWRIPRRGKFRAHLLAVEGQEEVHLFQYGHPADANQAHCAISLEALSASFVDTELPPKCRDNALSFPKNTFGIRSLERTLSEKKGALSKNAVKKLTSKIAAKKRRARALHKKLQEMNQSMTARAWLEREEIFDQVLFDDLQSIGVETVDDVLELTKIDLDELMQRVLAVKLQALKGGADAEREKLAADLKEIRQHFNAIRIVQKEPKVETE